MPPAQENNCKKAPQPGGQAVEAGDNYTRAPGWKYGAYQVLSFNMGMACVDFSKR
jgi:hypothetical protein